MNPKPAVTASRIKLDDLRAKQLREMLATPAMATLKEIISSECSRRQLEAIDHMMYQENNQGSETRAKAALALAHKFQMALDVLDEVQQSEEKWHTIAIEHRRS